MKAQMSHENCVPITEGQLREKYQEVVQAGENNYCFVCISLKNFSEYLHTLGQDNYHKLIATFLDCVCPLLRDGEYLTHIHFGYFNLLLKCEHNLDALHEIIKPLHFAVRDGMNDKFGQPLYIAMGFYPIAAPYKSFYDARYFADLSRKGIQYSFRETNYDMYGMSFLDRQEPFRKLQDLVNPAMEKGDFKLFLQPKVNTVTGEVYSAEALVRWIDPERGMIPLNDFLPQMEENGSIRDLDCYLFNIACGYMDRWLNTYGKKISISFNLDRAYFNGGFFMSEYTNIFNCYNIPPDCVCIELLESIVLEDKERLLPLVKDIYDFGFSCALDDFGSGFSSFSVLTSVRLSELKIDRSLFQNIENSKEKALVKNIVDIAHDFGMIAVAEGIETKEYADYLKEIGCDYIQGFYYYKPMHVDEFEARFITASFKEQ